MQEYSNSNMLNAGPQINFDDQGKLPFSTRNDIEDSMNRSKDDSLESIDSLSPTRLGKIDEAEEEKQVEFKK